MVNVLITGGNGQLGKDCAQVLQDRFHVTSIDIDDLDITQPDQVNDFIKKIRPDIIINCAAFTQVDACETDRDAAWDVNVNGPANLANSARHSNALLIHISTDYVFDGNKNPTEAYIETNIPSPMSHYGRSKLAGERSVINNARDYMILRTAWLYGIDGQNFIKAILKKTLAEPETTLKIVNDQYGSPTWSYRLALQIQYLIDHSGRGIYHASSEGNCTWYEFAGYFLNQLNIRHHIIPCTTDEYPTPAKRPKCAILENRRLKNENCNIMVHWQADLDAFLLQHKDRLIRECQP